MSTKFTQKEVINNIQEKLSANGKEFSKADIKAIYDAHSEVIEECMKNGVEVSVLGVGKVNYREVETRTYTNNLTGETKSVEVPAHTKVSIRVKGALKKIFK